MPISTSEGIVENNSEKRLCRDCNKPTRMLLNTLRNTTTTTEVCDNFDCVAGPGGLMAIRTGVNKNGDSRSITKFAGDGSFHELRYGRPSQHEANVPNVTNAFIAGANLQYATKFARFELASQNSREEEGYDCEIFCNEASNSLKLQVTRALPSEFYAVQAKKIFLEIKGTPSKAYTWIEKALQRKRLNAALDIALVIDAIEATALGFVDHNFANFKEQLIADWHSVWIVGHFGLRHVGGRSLQRPIHDTRAAT